MNHHFPSPFTCNENLPGPTVADMCNASTFAIFMSLLGSFVQKDEKISGTCDRVKSIDSPNPEYDYIVVGGGAAGSIVAARLSEISSRTVLLLEAGDDEPAAAGIPSFWSDVSQSRVDWDYRTTNESHACLATNGSCLYTAGKVLGGGSTINGMIYLRGNPTDYNNWAALGNEGWTWDEVKPFFLKSEDNGEIDRVGRFWHATGGPLSVERYPYRPPFADSILEAAKEAGFGISQDLNGDNITGFSVIQATSKNGVRRSSAASFLRPIRNRENLHISLNSTVTRVVIENGTAVGVEYFQNGEFKTVSATQEVVVSAGAVRSPQILLLSGIGPEEDLKLMGIEVVQDLPGVGHNYHDHMYFMMNFTINEPDVYDNNWAAATEYLAFQTGPLSSTGLGQVVGELVSSGAPSDYPDIQIISLGYSADCAPGDIGALQSTGNRKIVLITAYQHPKSRGRISLASNDPLNYPIIWGNYLSESSDVDGLVEAINSGMKLTDANALKAYNMTLSASNITACSNYTYPSNDFWKCAIQQDTYPQAHGSGTCKMGPEHDAMAVVDHELRVRGIKGLRVADTSIMPQITSCNTAAPAMMIGERAAEFIKKDAGWRSDV